MNSPPMKGTSSSEAPKINGGEHHRQIRAVQAPVEFRGVLVLDPLIGAVHVFLHAVLEPVGGEHGNQGESEDQRADQRERHGLGHGMEELAGRAAERVDGKIAGEDDGDGIEDGPVDVVRRREDNFVQFVVLAVPRGQFAVDVFHHHHGAVDDDAEIDGADGEQVGRTCRGRAEQ